MHQGASNVGRLVGIGLLLLVSIELSREAKGGFGDQQHRLRAADAAADVHSQFGDSVGVDGELAIVGVPEDGPVGSAYIFDVNTGQQLRKLTPEDAVGGAYFGSSVAIDGRLAIVGAPANKSVAWEERGSAGSAYLFDVTSGQQLFRLTADLAISGNLFGWAVALDGSRAIIGAPAAGEAGTNTGTAYLMDVTTGQQLLTLTADDPGARDGFASSVDIHGNTAIVGSRWDDDLGESTGAAYLFDVTSGQQLHKVRGHDTTQGDRIGISVGIHGNTAIAGAFADDDAGKSSGTAFVFDVTTGEQRYKLVPDDTLRGDHFGWSVAVSGDTAAVGAITGANVASNLLAGKAYLFDVITGEQLVKLVATDNAPFDQFGHSVAIDGNTTIIGAPQTAAPFDPALDPPSGKAYIFDATVPEPSAGVLFALGLCFVFGSLCRLV